MIFSLTVEDIDKEREVVVMHYTFVPGFTAIINRAPEDCTPGEPDRVEDVECQWFDTKTDLTQEEYELHQEVIEAAIFAYMEDSRG